MAQDFKNFSDADVAVGGEDVYVVPAGRTAVILHLQASNIDTVNIPTVDVWWTDSSNANARQDLLKKASIPVGAAIGCVDGKLVLEAGDKIRAQASADGDVSISGSVMEMY